MDVKEVTKSLDSFIEFINDGAEGKVTLTEAEAVALDAEVPKLFKNVSNDVITAKVAKVANMDILKMKAHFFDNLPNTWFVIQNATELSVDVKPEVEPEA